MENQEKPKTLEDLIASKTKDSGLPSGIEKPKKPQDPGTLVIPLKDKVLHVRKWKGRDKREFVNLMKADQVKEDQVTRTLVFNCITHAEDASGTVEPEDLVLSPDEFKYVISRIRSFSLGEIIKYRFLCSKCEQTSDREYMIEDILRGEYEPGESVQSGDVLVVLGSPKNKKVYNELIQKGHIYDFFLRIREIHDSSGVRDTFTLEEIVDYFDDLDVDVLDDLLSQYDKIRFKVNDVNEFRCDCGHKEKFHFDELPDFFPPEWFVDQTMIGNFR